MLTKWDFFTILGILIVTIAFFLIFMYFKNQQNECINNPLVFGAKQLTDLYGFEFKGSGFFEVTPGYNPPIVNFNSTDVNIRW